MEFDKNNNLHSIPSKYGSRATLVLSVIFHVITIIFWGLFVYQAHLGIFGIAAVVFSLIMLGYEHYLVRLDFTKIDRAFFTVNGYLGFVFFGCVIMDKVIG
jgi:4-hydroxybenzoate polyprenyltransferase